MIALYEKISSDQPNRYRFVQELNVGWNAIWPEGCAVQINSFAGHWPVVTIEPGYCGQLTIRETTELQVISTRTLNKP